MALELSWSRFKFNDEEALLILRFLLNRIDSFGEIPSCQKSDAMWSIQILSKLLTEEHILKELWISRIPERQKRETMEKMKELDPSGSKMWQIFESITHQMSSS
jgi:hypothetical protein